MKDGTVILYNYRDGINWFINKFNKIVYKRDGPTHAGIIGYQDGDYYYLYEATKKGVVVREYEKWWVETKCREGILDAYEPSEKLFNIKPPCDRYLGKKYAVIDLFSILLSYVFRFKIDFTNSRKVICSEAVALILKDMTKGNINLSEEYDKPFSYITPMDLKESKYLKYIKV